MKAKCIRNYGWVEFFEVGKVYEVRQNSMAKDFLDVLKDGKWSMQWCSSRFEVVDDFEEEIVLQQTRPLNHKEISSKLVDKLFAIGDENGKQTGRIQFMVGEYGVDEESAGGMNREALQRFMERELSILLKENT